MSVYMVERDLPGITLEQLAGAQKAAIQTSEEFSARGKAVRYIRSTFVPGESRCMCLFEASNERLVEEVNDTAKIPYTRVVAALDLTPLKRQITASIAADGISLAASDLVSQISEEQLDGGTGACEDDGLEFMLQKACGKVSRCRAEQYQG